MKRIFSSIPTTIIRLNSRPTKDFVLPASSVKLKTLTYDLLLGLFSIVSIILSTTSYEASFSSNRTHSNCDYNKNTLYPYLILSFSGLSLIILLLKYKAQALSNTLQWKFLIIPEVLILSIFEYPDLQGNIKIEQPTRFTTLSGQSVSNLICYKVSKILYLLSLRLGCFLLKFLTNMRNLFNSI